MKLDKPLQLIWCHYALSSHQQMKLDINPLTERVDPITVGSNPRPVSEKLVFLCGQCSNGFGSLEACKQHMMQVMHSGMEYILQKLILLCG
jgi:hypothetical protein